MKCSNREIGRHLPEYIEKNLSGALRREFEVHLFECPYCWGQVQQAEKDEEIDTLIRTYGREAFQEISNGNNKLRVKRLAHDFIQEFYPSELNLFDLAWRIFNDITPKDLTQEAVSAGLGIVGEETSQLKTPKIIVLLNCISNEDVKRLSDIEAKEAINKIGRSAGCSGELIDKITDFVLKG